MSRPPIYSGQLPRRWTDFDRDALIQIVDAFECANAVAKGVSLEASGTAYTQPRASMFRVAAIDVATIMPQARSHLSGRQSYLYEDLGTGGWYPEAIDQFFRRQPGNTLLRHPGKNGQRSSWYWIPPTHSCPTDYNSEGRSWQHSADVAFEVSQSPSTTGGTQARFLEFGDEVRAALPQALQGAGVIWLQLVSHHQEQKSDQEQKSVWALSLFIVYWPNGSQGPWHETPEQRNGLLRAVEIVNYHLTASRLGFLELESDLRAEMAVAYSHDVKNGLGRVLAFLSNDAGHDPSLAIARIGLKIMIAVSYTVYRLAADPGPKNMAATDIQSVQSAIQCLFIYYRCLATAGVLQMGSLNVSPVDNVRHVVMHPALDCDKVQYAVAALNEVALNVRPQLNGRTTITINWQFFHEGDDLLLDITQIEETAEKDSVLPRDEHTCARSLQRLEALFGGAVNYTGSTKSTWIGEKRGRVVRSVVVRFRGIAAK